MTKLSRPSLDRQDSKKAKRMEDGSTGHDSGSLIPVIGRDLSIHCLIHLSRKDYPSVTSMNRSFRYVIQSGKIFRLRRQMGIIEHWVYLSCKLLQWVAFDPFSRKWFKLPIMETHDYTFMVSHKESLAVSTQLLVFGKETESFAVYKYSILTNSWSVGAKPISPRCLFASASVGEIGIIAGGCSSEGNILSSAELYNSETGNWETLPSMNTPRKLCSGVIMDGKYFYAIGGIGVDKVTPLVSTEVFDIEKRTWHEIPNMFTLHNGENGMQLSAANAQPLVAVVKNELYGAFYKELEVRKYDKKMNVWIPMGKLPEYSCSVDGSGIAFRACGDVIIVIGGPRTLVGGFMNINTWEPSNDGAPLQWTFLERKLGDSFVYNCAVMGC